MENKIKELNISELKERRKRFKEYECKLLNFENKYKLNERDIRYIFDK